MSLWDPSLPRTLFLSSSRKRFKDFCRAQGLSAHQVLDQLTDLYVSSQGRVVEGQTVGHNGHSMPPAPVPLPEETTVEIIERIERLECDDREFVHAFEVLIHRVEALEVRLGSSKEEPKHTPKH